MAENELFHIGTKRHSGRYPWGSGNNSKQDSADFLGYVEKLKAKGMSETEIASAMGIKTTELRNRKTIANNAKRASDEAMASRLFDKGLSKSAIARKMGINESSVRALLNPTLKARSEVIKTTADTLKQAVDKKKYIDVGLGVETELGISATKLRAALQMLKDIGYNVFYIPVKQLGTGKDTSIKVLCKPGIKYSDAFKDKANIKLISEMTATLDSGKTFMALDKPVEYISSNRVMINYKETGGANKDGVIELRRGVTDLDLGQNKYAQVRIGVDGTHFIKGMAVYSDKMPKGVDIIFNTNKSNNLPMKDVLKPVKSDPDNPFGTAIKKGGQRGALNMVYEEGDWGEWQRTISSQILSKQSPQLAAKQLKLAYDISKDEFETIKSLTNPTIKKVLLKEFSEDLDSSAVHLKAAALPRQRQHVILPLTTIKENEIYAPGYENGESVVLFRHPHGGTFEIPELRVNNTNAEAKAIFQNAKDAVGIHPKTAQKLSGADFDGDSVIVIPNRERSIKTSDSLASLKDFVTTEAYPGYPGMPKLSPEGKQKLMGDVSNLITDMTIKGATPTEVGRAIKHSMVVIDAEKHNLNYRQSFIDNGIAALKDKYQRDQGTGGAATLISRAKSVKFVEKRKDRYDIDPKTGEKIYFKDDKSFVDKETGKLIQPKTKTSKMADAKDAYELSSGTKMEGIYGDHANNLKALANQARLEYLNTPPLKYSPTAKETYSQEVSVLKAKLGVALRNKPHERQAQLLANETFKIKKDLNPDWEAKDIKKVKGQELEKARLRVGAKKQKIEITDKEWEAIQAGAITNNTLMQILLNADSDKVKERAMPRTAYKVTDAKAARAKALAAMGYTQAEIASNLGLSVSTIKEILP
jgi:DNA-binding CsgD family transcriptional regulator